MQDQRMLAVGGTPWDHSRAASLPWQLRAINQKQKLSQGRSSQSVGQESRLSGSQSLLFLLNFFYLYQIISQGLGNHTSVPPPPTNHPPRALYSKPALLLSSGFLSCPKYHNEKTQKLNILVKNPEREKLHMEERSRST